MLLSSKFLVTSVFSPCDAEGENFAFEKCLKYF